jgi:hypothetical protein
MSQKTGVPIKEANKLKMLEYLGNPDNEWLDRSGVAKQVLGYKNPQPLWRQFSLSELVEIEREALDLRRGKYARHLAHVDHGLLKAAKAGDARAAKLVYQRFENWSEKTEVKHSGSVEIGGLSHEQIESQLAAVEAEIARITGAETETASRAATAPSAEEN